MADLESEIRRLLESHAKQKAAPQRAGITPRDLARGPREARQRLDVVIGLDFGTRFTKAAYRIAGVDETSIIVPDLANPDSALFKSSLFIDRPNLTAHRKAVRGIGIEELPYLKLLLKNVEQPQIVVPMMLRQTIDHQSIKALSAFFLSGVLRTAALTILEREKARTLNKDVIYAVNVSLPADHCDDSARDRFKEVTAVALHWAMQDLGAADCARLSDLVSSYTRDAPIASRQSEIGVFPEIIAALYQFITRSDTPAVIHGFLDIGGGTVDGCIFRIIREGSGALRVNILSARVETLGTIIVSKKSLMHLVAGIEQKVEREIVKRDDINIEIPLPLDRPAKELKDFAAKLLIAAQQKSPGKALVQNPSDVHETKDLIRALKTPFTFMVSGGGAGSGWYKKSFAAVYHERNLSSVNIMPFDCQIVSPPNDFEKRSAVAFERFIIAYGLTNDAPNLESLTTKLPSELADGVEPRSRTSRGPGGIGYFDSKDAYT